MDGSDRNRSERVSEDDAGASNKTQTKRAACDRCRGQKLRCLVEHDDSLNGGKCKRCLAAKTACSFSLSKRAGRPPSTNAQGSVERRKRAKEREDARNGDSETDNGRVSAVKNIGSRSNSELGNSNGSHTDLSSLADWRLDPTTETNQILDSLPGDASAIDMLQHQDHTAFSSAISPSTISSGWTHETFSMPEKAAQGVMDGFPPDTTWGFASDSQSRNTSIGFSPNETYGSLGGIRPHELLMTQWAAEHTSSATPFLDTYSSTSDKFSLHGAGSMGIGKTTPNSLRTSNPGRTYTERQSQSGVLDSFRLQTSSKNLQQRRVQELSELNITLHSQIMAADSDLSRGTSLPDASAQLASEVLKSSSAFLSLLQTFFKQDQRSAKIMNSEPIDETLSESEISDLDGSPGKNTASGDCVDVSSTGSQFQDESSPIAADMATVLQLLTCYFYILNLHSLSYSRTLEYLSDVGNRKVDPPLLFPGLQLGGMILDSYGTFQVKFMLQIITHVLGEIETALGLPEGYRVSKKSSKHHGILEASVSAQFVETMMRENSRMKFGLGPDGISKIRENLRSLKEQVRGSINI